MESVRIHITTENNKIIENGKLQFKLTICSKNKYMKTIDPNKYLINNRDLIGIINYENPEDQCPICLENLESKAVLACGHEFHYNCIEKWLYDNDSCPMCREKLPIFSINIPLSEFSL